MRDSNGHGNTDSSIQPSLYRLRYRGRCTASVDSPSFTRQRDTRLLVSRTGALVASPSAFGLQNSLTGSASGDDLMFVGDPQWRVLQVDESALVLE